jgi:T5orf172 domain
MDIIGDGLGVIYILTDPRKTLSKIGRTSAGTAAGRASEYGKAHGYRWTVFAQLASLRVAEVEANIHAQFWTKRVQTATNAREIFKVRPAEAEAVARSMVLPPGSSPDAIKKHVKEVRLRLEGQENFILSRSSYTSMQYIEMNIYPQYLALDALERGISTQEMLNIYERMESKRQLELDRIQADADRLQAAYYAKSIAEWKAKHWWSKAAEFWTVPRPTDMPPGAQRTKIQESLYPAPPRYAPALIRQRRRR